MMTRLFLLSVFAATCGPVLAQQGVQADDAARVQRRLELRHAIEAQRISVQRDAPIADPQGRSLSAEQRAQLREDLRRQSMLRQTEAPGMARGLGPGAPGGMPGGPGGKRP